jgi:hypothetical protein
MSKSKSKKGRYNGEMIPYAVRLPSSLLEQAKERAGMIPFSRIIRALILMWLEGKISKEDIEKFDKEG